MSSTQVAVRFGDELLRDLDWLVVHGDYGNRAEAIRAALAQVIDVERRREIGEQIAEGYRRIPETDDELAWLDRRDLFPGLPADEWDDVDWKAWARGAG